MQRENAKNMGEIVRLFIQEEGLAEGLRRVRVALAWDEVCGERAAHATLQREFRNGILYCTLNSSAVRSLLFMQKPQLIERLNRHLGAEVVRDIRLK